MIEAKGLTKHYGAKHAVEQLSFTVRPGRHRISRAERLGQVDDHADDHGSRHAPTSGDVTVKGKHFRDLSWPFREVGALLEAKAIHPGRSARAHLKMLAQTNHISNDRVDELLEVVGLTAVANKRAGKFSLGMGQRLGIAAALLGDPEVLLFDEPVNGLDPDGIRWVRNLLKGLARKGRTVFVSSHLMSEMALTADEVVIIGKGKLISQTSIEDLLSKSTEELRACPRTRGRQVEVGARK